MPVRRKEWKQFIPRPLDEVWNYFSRPENLNEITPPDMAFEILSPVAGVPMYEGMLIRYRVSPFRGIKMNWVTEITHIKEGQYFVDEQRLGPYALWHHEHHFKEQDGGVLMTDLLHYQVPYGIIGAVADRLVVNRRVEEIFRFRRKVVAEVFGGEVKV
ncbi:MAG: SRPBCC family protein [Phaeodactylibacter sp.]|nr:SRPBCC family protein [Phaeodactylibacter sp.]